MLIHDKGIGRRADLDGLCPADLAQAGESPALALALHPGRKGLVKGVGVDIIRDIRPAELSALQGTASTE